MSPKSQKKRLTLTHVISIEFPRCLGSHEVWNAPAGTKPDWLPLPGPMSSISVYLCGKFDFFPRYFSDWFLALSGSPSVAAKMLSASTRWRMNVFIRHTLLTHFTSISIRRPRTASTIYSRYSVRERERWAICHSRYYFTVIIGGGRGH